MLIRVAPSGPSSPLPSEITPRTAWLQRRALLRGLALTAAGTSLGNWAVRDALAQTAAPVKGPGKLAALSASRSAVAGAVVMDRPTAYADITNYNNFYEFTTDKQEVAGMAAAMKTKPWQVRVEGLVRQPKTFDLADLLKLAPMEERIYRLRCVEGWSMVIPWVGYSLAELLRRVEPLGSARFVEFVTLADKAVMPGVGRRVLDWPYTEGLRLDEAQHPLTMLAFGLYGEVLPNQNGAPVRLVVPWKYGFKSAKSLVAIRLTEQQPRTAWGRAAPQEYGFYSNVNPDVPHPRWSQATERRIGEDGLLSKKRKTLMFNGYEAQVGQLYAGMDLRQSF